MGCHADGVPDFRGLMAGSSAGFCAWGFDLLMINGRDITSEPLERRRTHLAQLLESCSQRRHPAIVGSHSMIRPSSRGGGRSQTRRDRVERGKVSPIARAGTRAG